MISRSLPPASGLPQTAPVPSSPTSTVTLVVMDGFHGQLEPFVRPQYSERPLGGFAQFTTELRTLSDKADAMLMGTGGDLYTGPEVSNRYGGAPVIDVMNQQGCGFWAINNHDFDFGPSVLKDRLAEAKFPALAGNLIENHTGRPIWETDHSLNTLLPYTTKTLAGLKVGIVGLLKPEAAKLTLAPNMAGLSVMDPGVALDAIIPDLMKKEHPGCILVSCQTQDRAEELCRRIQDLAHKTTGERPFVVLMGGKKGPAIEGDGYIITSAEDRASELNAVNLTVDKKTSKVLGATWEHRFVQSDEVAPDPDMAALVQTYVDRVQGDMSRTVAYAPAHLRRANDTDCAMGNLVTDAVRWSTGADIAFESGGFMKGDLFAGPIRVADCYAAMPFENRFSTLTLTGRQVRQVLEDSVAPKLNKRVVQQSGLRMSYDPQLPVGQRVQSVSMANGAPLDDNREYRVAVNEYLSYGGDGHETLGAIGTGEMGSRVRDIVVDYLSQVGVTTTSGDGRIECLNRP